MRRAPALPPGSPIVVVTALALAAAALCAPCAAAQSRHPHAVRLRDGTLLRGTITDRDAEHVVIVLPTGATRTLDSAEVELAGPVDEVTSSRPTSTPRGSTPRRSGAQLARVRVVAEQDDLSLHRVTRTSSVPMGTGNRITVVDVDEYEALCSAPCTFDIEPGGHQLGIARGDGSPVRAGAPVEVFDGMRLVLHHENRVAYRQAGWVAWIGGGAVGLGVFLWGLVGGSSDEYGRIIDAPLVIAGGVTIAVAMLVGIPLSFLNDAGRIEARF